MSWVLKPASGKKDSNPARRTSEPALCTMELTPHCRRRFTSRKQGTQEARTVPQRLRRAKASAQTHREGLHGIPAPLEGGRTSRPERAHTCDWGGGNVWIWGTGHPLPPQFAAQVPRRNLQTPRRPASAAPQHSPVGQSSPPPRESQLYRDPEVNLESLARLLEFRLFPGHSLAGRAVAVETAAMAAPCPASSRTAQREEPARSAESSDTVRTPVPIVSTVSPELHVSPGQGVEPPGKNLWEQICQGRQPGPAERGGTRQAGGRVYWAPTVRQAPDVRGLLGSRAAGPRGSPCHRRGN